MANNKDRPTSTPIAPGFVLWQQQDPDTATPTHSPQAPSSPVLVLLFTWLFCKPGAAARYAQLYTSRGYHVLQISSSLYHFLWPPNSRTFAVDIAKVLQLHFANYGHIVVHAMSIGAYNYTTCLMLAGETPDLDTYLFSKLRGVVFDSLTLGSLDHMMQGIAVGFSQWSIVQKATTSLANLYFLLTYRSTVEAFYEGVQFFKTNPARVPTLALASEDDPMCDPEDFQSLVTNWKISGILPVTSQVWKKSGHCAHLIHHGDQYARLLDDFLMSLQSCFHQTQTLQEKCKL